MADEVEMVQLRNGKEAPRSAVGVLRITLNTLFTSNPLAFFEAAMVARDPGHVPFGNLGQALEDFNLTEGGVMHDLTRDVILSSVTGDGIAMHLVDPVAAQ